MEQGIDGRFPRSFICFDELDAELAFYTKTHDVYFCPFCYGKEVHYGVKDPKKDTHGKLYVDRKSHKGYCHRCNTVIFNKREEDDFAFSLKNLLVEDTLPDVSELPDLNLDDLPYAAEIQEAKDYLNNRNPNLTEDKVKSLDMKWFEEDKFVKDCIDGWLVIKRKGILTPIKYRGKTKSYQIRYITDDKHSRFHTMSGLRLLYTPKEVPIHNEITICEGVYDALGCMAMDFPNPVALLGKTPSKIQLKQIRELMPYHVNLCLDEYSLGYEVLRMLRKELKTIETTKIWKWKNAKDPEEFYRKNRDFKYSFEKR